MESKSVDIGACTLTVVVSGTGPKTVVFENGLATSLESWDAVAGSLSAHARTVRYDRRAAPPSPLLPRTAMDMAIDLKRLLDTLAFGPPYVLVSHSWGGAVARLFTHAHPKDVAGLVLVDATHEAIDSRGIALLPLMYSVMGLASRFDAGRRWLLGQFCPPAAPVAYRERVERMLNDRAQWTAKLRTAKAESAGIRPSLAELRHVCPDLPPIPIRVLTAGGVTGANAKSVKRVHDAWQATVARTPTAKYTNIPTSGHQLPLESPQAIVEAVLEVLHKP